MEKAKRVIDFYIICNRLKDVIRTGWIDWNVKRERIESVAEHIYGVQMFAIAMASEYDYDVDLYKVIMMLAIHELEETVIGDQTLFQISKDEKEEIGHQAVKEILKELKNGEEIEKLILEFDERKTKEAFFAYQCDKLECDTQAKLYDEQDCVDLNNQENNQSLNNETVKKLIEEGNSFSNMWLAFGRSLYPYDENFQEVSNYLSNTKIKIRK